MKNIAVTTKVLVGILFIIIALQGIFIAHQGNEHQSQGEEMIPITVSPGEIERLNPGQWSDLIYSTTASVFITGACTEKLQLLSKRDILRRTETEGELIQYQTFRFRCQNNSVEGRLEVLDVEAYTK